MRNKLLFYTNYPGCGILWSSSDLGGTRTRTSQDLGPALSSSQAPGEFIQPSSPCLSLTHRGSPEAPLKLPWAGKDLLCYGLQISGFSYAELQTDLLSEKQNCTHLALLWSRRLLRCHHCNLIFFHSNFCLAMYFLVATEHAHLQKVTSFLWYCDNIITITDENALFICSCNLFFIL